MKTVVLGSGGWGTALALLLLENGHEVTLWSFSEQECRQLREKRENPLLEGVSLPEELTLTTDLQVVRDCRFVIMATPSFAVRQTARQIAPLLQTDAIVVSVSKGIEKESSLRLSQVIREEIKDCCPVAVLTGPTHAEEVARRVPTACVAACQTRLVAEQVQDLFITSRFRVYATDDVIGVELGAALKNVMALCAGCCTGMGLGDNTKAMLITRGLSEMARLGVAMGGKLQTFAGLAGMGDLIVTCTSLNSRNNRAGILVGQGVPVEEAIARIGAVVEGYYAVDSARTLARKLGVEMPITEAAYRTFYENAEIHAVVAELMHREKRHESEDSWV